MEYVITFPSYGTYEDCTLTVQDHAGNNSETITLPTMLYKETINDFCTHPDLTIPQVECEALLDLYEET